MFFEDPETIAYSVALVVPGFVWTQVEHRFIPRKRVEWSERLLGYVVYTLINYAVFWVLFLPSLIKSSTAESITGCGVLQWMVVLVIAPAVGGVATGIWSYSNTLGWILRKAKLPATIDPNTPTGWEKAFTRRRSCIAKITLKDGQTHIGVLGPESCASSDPDERDLFLQQACAEDGDRMSAKPCSLGLWFAKDEIKMIEFGQIM